MKKLYTLIVAALMGMNCAQAQTIFVTQKDGSVQTLKADDVEKIEYTDMNAFHEFTGYLVVNSKYFQNMYYGDQAKIVVYMGSDRKHVKCSFEDAQWGKGMFDVEMNGMSMTGTGKILMGDPMSGSAPQAYDATLSGGMTDFTITLPTVMGGTTIQWTYGVVPAAYLTAGKYTGTDHVSILSVDYPSVDPVAYQVKANADKTINLIVPEQKYANTPVGNITVGTYTIPNIPYDETTKSFTKAYKDDNITFHLTMENNGVVTIDKDYTMDKDICKVSVKLDDDGQLVVNNNYQMGAMPFPIAGTFTGTKSAGTR